MELISSAVQDSPISKIRFHPGGQFLLTLSATSPDLCLWACGEPARLALATTARSGSKRAIDAAFHPSGAVVAVVGMDRAIEIRRLPDLEVLTAYGSANGPEDYRGYSAVAFSARGDLLVATSLGALETEVYAFESGQLLQKYWGDAFNTCFALHPEGEILANVMNDQGASAVRFGLLTDRFHPYRLELKTYMDIGGIVFSPDGKALAVVGGIPPGRLQVHEFPTLERRFQKTFQHSQALSALQGGSPLIERVAWSADATRVICPQPSGNLVEFDSRSGSQVSEWHAHKGAATTVDVRNNILGSAGMEGSVLLWELRSTAEGPSTQGKRQTETFLNMTQPAAPFESWRGFDTREG